MDAKILVVEDERITAEDIKRSLEKAGYNVPVIVSTGEDAVKFSEKYKPDLVLMDIVLEGNIDGIEAAETIRTKFDIPVIYLTAYSDKLRLNGPKQPILRHLYLKSHLDSFINYLRKTNFTLLLIYSLAESTKKKY